ncbi:hypothetical protein Hanom_Chr03g00258271 [Helianthus anomalus]
MPHLRLDGMAPSPIRPPCATPVLLSRHPRLHPIPVLSVGISTLRTIQRWAPFLSSCNPFYRIVIFLHHRR